MRDRLPELAALDITRIQHRSRRAALECALVARQVQISLFLVRVMAFRAIGLDERKDVILVGDLVFGEGGKHEQLDDTKSCNPEGIAPSSPGLRGTSYPGGRVIRNVQP